MANDYYYTGVLFRFNTYEFRLLNRSRIPAFHLFLTWSLLFGNIGKVLHSAILIANNLLDQVTNTVWRFFLLLFLFSKLLVALLQPAMHKQINLHKYICQLSYVNVNWPSSKGEFTGSIWFTFAICLGWDTTKHAGIQICWMQDIFFNSSFWMHFIFICSFLTTLRLTYSFYSSFRSLQLQCFWMKLCQCKMRVM